MSASHRGLYLGAARDAPVLADPEQGVLILGPPRSGKTSAIVVPNVLRFGGPVVSTSTKVDVMTVTLASRQQRGRCWLFDPSGTTPVPAGLEVLRWSPLTGSLDWDGARLMARAMVGSSHAGRSLFRASHWTERAEALLGPLLHAGALGMRDVATLVGWVDRRDPEPALEILAGAGERAQVALDLLTGIAATHSEEQSGIWSTASGVIGAYRGTSVRERSADPNFDAVAFVESSDTVYVCAPGREQALVAPLVVGMLEDIRAAAYARCARLGSGSPAEPSAIPVLLALDEVANIAPLPDLPQIVSEGGSQGLLTLACLQDLSQARARWGQEADGFGSLFGAMVVLAGIGDPSTLDAISKRCGEEEVRVRSDTVGRSSSATWSYRRQPRVPAGEVATGRPGAALVLGGGHAPAWVGLTPWYTHELWRRLAEAGGRRPAEAGGRRPAEAGGRTLAEAGLGHVRDEGGRGPVVTRARDEGVGRGR